MENIIKKIRLELHQSCDEKTKASSQKFFKETIRFYGVQVPVVNKISKEYFKQLASSSKTDIFEYVIKNKSRMPRTSLRYAIEKMPKDLKSIAMAK
ncbi:MAG: DNA alkylation repair protein [Cyclobacteriaceae bacterium]|nr:DNA alkylation repair protein [Cyclobacteriaceae bacterium]